MSDAPRNGHGSHGLSCTRSRKANGPIFLRWRGESGRRVEDPLEQRMPLPDTDGHSSRTAIDAKTGLPVDVGVVAVVHDRSPFEKLS